MTGTWQKANLYILSLGLLFVFIMMISIDVSVSSRGQFPYILFDARVANMPVMLIAGCFLIYCAFAYMKFSFDLKGTTNIPFEVKSIESINYEHLTFLATYVVPLISFDFGNFMQILVLLFLLIVMGVIYIKTDLFYANPSLALFGYHIYRAKGHFKMGSRSGIILVCRGNLSAGEKVAYIKLDERIYYVKKIQDDKGRT